MVISRYFYFPSDDFLFKKTNKTSNCDVFVKIWSLATQHMLYAFPAEHSRSSFFRSMGQGNGVNQVIQAASISFNRTQKLTIYYYVR